MYIVICFRNYDFKTGTRIFIKTPKKEQTGKDVFNFDPVTLTFECEF